jgi:hypothetical protein
LPLTGRSIQVTNGKYFRRAPCQGQNLNSKVLGKEFEEEPFFKRVFLNITCKNFCKSTTFKAVLLTDYLLAALFFHQDHVTGATNSEENVPEIRPHISGTEKLRSES